MFGSETSENCLGVPGCDCLDVPGRRSVGGVLKSLGVAVKEPPWGPPRADPHREPAFEGVLLRRPRKPCSAKGVVAPLGMLWPLGDFVGVVLPGREPRRSGRPPAAVLGVGGAVVTVCL